MTIYLVKGFPEYAATSLTDAQSLFTALLDPSDATNAATIDRVMGKISPVTVSDTGEPLILSSVDDAAGTYSSWVTDASTTLAVAIGDPDTNSNANYASTLSFAITGSTRTGTLSLDTNQMRAAINRGRMAGFGCLQPITLQLQIIKTTAGATQTVGQLRIRVLPPVTTGTPTDLPTTAALSVAAARAGFLINLSGVTSLTGGGATTLDGQDAGSTTFPVGCIAVTSDSSVGRLWKLIGTNIAATDLALGLVKPTNSDATLNPVHWKLI